MSPQGKVQKPEGELVKYNKAVFLPYGLSYVRLYGLFLLACLTSMIFQGWFSS
jgi:hypothetical protein